MKQLLFCNKKHNKLIVRHTILTDVFVPVEDIISPQKTTLILPKTDKIELSDIIIIRDNNSAELEYIGYVETIVNKNKTEISCYPLINVFDNDYVLDQMFKTVQQKMRNEKGEIVKDKDGNEMTKNVDIAVNAVDWMQTQLKRAFLPPQKKDEETEEDFEKRLNLFDELQGLPLIIRNKTKIPVLYKKTIDTANLFEVYVDLFVNTGLYVSFSGLTYNQNEIDGIYCDICCNKDEKPYLLRYDYPLIKNFDIVDNTFINYNKIIATEELPEGVTTREPQRYYFYLLNDNSVTRNPKDERRIKQVRSKEITFVVESEDKTNEENAQALLLAVYNELQAPEYNLQITIDMFKNEHIKLYRRVDFLAESGIMYSSNITKIEKLNEKQVVITLGALRNSLTDFKKRVEAI